MEGIVGEVLKHSPRSVSYVELNPVLLDLALRHLPAEAKEPLSRENVRVTVADPRKFLGGKGLHDVVLVGMPEPASATNARKPGKSEVSTGMPAARHSTTFTAFSPG